MIQIGMSLWCMGVYGHTRPHLWHLWGPWAKIAWMPLCPSQKSVTSGYGYLRYLQGIHFGWIFPDRDDGTCTHWTIQETMHQRLHFTKVFSWNDMKWNHHSILSSMKIHDKQHQLPSCSPLWIWGSPPPGTHHAAPGKETSKIRQLRAWEKTKSLHTRERKQTTRDGKSLLSWFWMIGILVSLCLFWKNLMDGVKQFS